MQIFYVVMIALIVSPGISLAEPALVKAKQQGVELLGDLELFLEQAKVPVVIISGSNGKSTVTALLGKMAQDSGYKRWCWWQFRHANARSY